MTIEQYIDSVSQRYKLGNATEHTFRGDLQALIEAILPEIRATNEPKRQACGAPDYILTKKDIPIGYIEAKDIGDNDLDGLRKNGNKEQFDRYKISLNNIIFTDYLSFHLYRDGEFIDKVVIGEVVTTGKGGIKPIRENFETFTRFIKNFAINLGQTIKSSKDLAAMMAGKARLMAEIIEKALNSDEKSNEDSGLYEQLRAFKDILIYDITARAFADVYAQTIVYGMFAARLHDTDLNTFSRQKAAELIPKSNPFLRKLFQYIAGYDLDDRIRWVVDDLVNIFLASNVEEMLIGYGQDKKMEDPIIHFYEDFLSEYDPKLRKTRGVWYTPQPVVNFIVRAVDDILKTDFNLPQGLADTSKTEVEIEDTEGKKTKEEVHKVQILDPATGTGTFLAEVVKHIYKKFEGQQGIWSNYVEQHLLPRLNGFEILMASYAMAHLKLDLLLKETGYKPTSDQRMRIFLTNSLEESTKSSQLQFASWLANEAKEANKIKRETPVMCVIGNPPYAVSSSNRSNWIERLIDDYKTGLNEKKLNIDDDYIKFIRFGQHLIKNNGSGVLAYISNNSFIDGITHRQMRKNLLETFDKVYILDLHGNARKKETSPDGSQDQNVFDIMQGVSINLFVKTGRNKTNELGKVFHYELYGKRTSKYEFLNINTLKSVKWNILNPLEPYYFVVPKDFKNLSQYEVGFKLDHLFIYLGSGFSSLRDKVCIRFEQAELKKILTDFVNLDLDTLRAKYELNDSRDWKIASAKQDILSNYSKNYFQQILYRPFDFRFTFFTGSNRGFIGVPQKKIANNLSKYFDNIGIVVPRLLKKEFNNLMVSRVPVEYSANGPLSAAETNIAPLYLYPDKKKQESLVGDAEEPRRVPNLNMEIVNKIAEKLDLKFVAEKENSKRDENTKATKFPSIGGVSEGRGGALNNSSTQHTGENKKRELQNYYNLPFNPKLKARAKELRKAGNLSEVVLWNQLKNKQFKGLDFDRQKIVGNYIVDFYCINLNVVIEIDGNSHDDKVEYDAVRDNYLNGLGLKVIHILSKDVLHNLDGVMQMLMDHPAFESSENHPALSGTPPMDGNVLQNSELSENHPDFMDNFQKDGNVLQNSESSENHPALSGTPPMDGNVLQNSESSENHPALSGTPPMDGNVLKTNTFAPIDILDYIYAVLHSPNYREKYKEFLKIDFPRVPYPENRDIFWELVRLGGEIRQLHLLESPTVQQFITQYPVDGDNIVVKPIYKNGRVYINETQYFDNVPQIAWEFYIGGYQPAQKWLKDRKERELNFEEILHYQKIIVALTETDRLMKEIDKIIED